MSRNISDLHPDLQEKIEELKKECKKAGINIGIGECLRTVAEQNALYAKGRTAPGSIVTNCKGSDYKSMHQWGVAFDFYLIMDVDKDGKTSDDAYNDSTGLFTKVGKIGEKIGLEWGGSWHSIVDKPHFQLKYWGSTATQLKSKFGTPDKYMKTWVKKKENTKSSTTTTKKEEVKNEETKTETKDVIYTTVANLNMRDKAGTSGNIIDCVPKGKEVAFTGKFKSISGTKWFYCRYKKKEGYMSSKYLLKKKK